MKSYLKWPILAQLSDAKQRKLQTKKLRYLVKHVLPFHPYYAKVLREQGLTYKDFKTIEDIQKIPLISKVDIAPSDENPALPREFILQPTPELAKKHHPKLKLVKGLLGRNIEAKLEWEYKPIHVHFTTGRSSAKVPFMYTPRDLELLSITGERLFTTAGLDKTDIVVNAFPFAPHLAFWQVQKAAEEVQVRTLHSGGGKVLGTQKIIEITEKMNATVLVGMPGYVYHLLKVAYAEGREFASLKKIILGGERIVPGLRDKMRELYPNLEIVSTYAFTEAKTAWVQCSEGSMYHTYPDMEYVELVDADGNPVPEGEEGEIAYSALDWRGSMVLRYRTGDFAKGLYHTPCPDCGRTVPRIDTRIERKSDYRELNLSKVKGELINLNAFHGIIHDMKAVDEWQVEIRKKNDDVFEVDEIHLHISCTHEGDCDKCTIEIEKRVLDELSVRPSVKMLSRDELITRLGMETELKEKRIVDLR